MYRRKIERVLEEWKARQERKPLVIKGVRQCGKTSSVVDFAQRNYRYVVYLDFHQQEELIKLFDASLETDYLTLMISAALPSARFVPGETCIVFDEIQVCPRARASLKFFKLDGRYDVICTGSLLGVNGYSSTASLRSGVEATIPVGFEQIVDMYPMDFEEWLWANNMPKGVLGMLKTCLEEETPMPEALHNRLRELLLEYVVVGGMPEAVRTFFDTHDMNQVQAVQRAIVEEYKADMVKYAVGADRSRIRECFESIPRQLSRDNKKFTYSVVRRGGGEVVSMWGRCNGLRMRVLCVGVII